jgi:pyruvate dehydrogenase E1 component beta subunit
MSSVEPRHLSFAAAVREATEQEMERDEQVLVMGLDVDDHKAIQGTTRGLVQRFGRDRIFSTPLSEDAMTGVAIGAAMAGMRPIHVHIRMDFLMLCMNQLVNIAAKSRYMYGGAVSVPLVVRCIIGKSWGQGAQHSQGLHAMFMHVPGFKVVAPSTPRDAKGCLVAAIRDDDPVIFVEHRLLYPTVGEVPEAPYAVELGRARIAAPGADVTIVGISSMVAESLRARQLLAAEGISAEVVDPVTLVPLDLDTILASARRTGRLLVVDTAWTMCGASSEIVAAVLERAGPDAGIAARRLGFAPTTCPTSPPLEALFYPNPATIAAAAHALVRPGERPWKPPHHLVAGPEAAFRGPF